ncbi:Transcription factor PRE3 [Striga hermonthica]|uniref:Transcription factor PRE3 n=1 Tax=Striga hermonthica TaxID=68872 RepID=A0A9N7RG98_STRHE|nr:Transcription factor PRE3 [Striga hermonthica]
MSNRRGPRQVARFTEAEVNELILKLQALLPHSTSTSCNTTKIAASKVLRETCNYIKNLHKEVDDLSERLSELLANGEITNADADFIRRLLKQ